MEPVSCRLVSLVHVDSIRTPWRPSSTNWQMGLKKQENKLPTPIKLLSALTHDTCEESDYFVSWLAVLVVMKNWPPWGWNQGSALQKLTNGAEFAGWWAADPNQMVGGPHLWHLWGNWVLGLTPTRRWCHKELAPECFLEEFCFELI